jgi:hypothetical protein
VCQPLPPGTVAMLAVTGLDPDPLYRPMVGDDEPDFARKDEFDGEGFSHRVTMTGPKGTAISTIHSPGPFFTVVDAATGEEVYRADMSRPIGAPA